MKTEFQTFGFFKEYWKDGKFLGTLTCDQDREVFGYYGQKMEILKEDIVFRNKKKVKAGTEVKTMLFPLCGRLKEEINKSDEQSN